jgi:2-keto-3-deoxy-L-rhamnonate aldolase RhmA
MSQGSRRSTAFAWEFAVCRCRGSPPAERPAAGNAHFGVSRKYPSNAPRRAISATGSRTGNTCSAPFIKIPTSHTIEIVGLAGFDFVIDQEHGTFDRSAIDIACLAARAAGIAAVVRVPEANAAAIMAVLDCGANGIMVPHCDSAEKARAIAAACRHRGGVRGFATTTRAGAYGGIEAPIISPSRTQPRPASP